MHKIIFVTDGAENAREKLDREQLRNVSEDFVRGFADLEKIGQSTAAKVFLLKELS
jgi:hypothetical protein